MKIVCLIPLLLLTIYCFSSELSAQEDSTKERSSWKFDVSYGGVALNVPLPLTIKQDGYDDIYIPFAKFRSEEYIMPWYWLWRFSKVKNQKSWEFEAIHHKLFLQNEPEEVGHFNISHGYNLLHINRGFEKEHFNYKVGLGIVLAHPESQVRGKRLDQHQGLLNWGYYVSGPSFSFALNREYNLTKWLYVWGEAKTNFSHGRIPIANGHANMWQLSLHCMVSLGVKFI